MWMRALLLMLAWAVSPALTMSYSYYIIPTNDSEACNFGSEASQFDACLTLHQFTETINSGSNVFTGDNVTMTFAPGRHFLMGGVVFIGTVEVFIIGQADSVLGMPQITCTEASCFLLLNTSKIHIEGLIFTESSSDELDGGAVYVHQAQSVNITQCMFTNNTIQKHGGAISVQQTETVHIIQSQFFNNSASCFLPFLPAADRYCFTGCIATGGAVSFSNVSNFKIGDSTFDSNSATCFSGAIFLSSSSGKIINSMVVRNQIQVMSTQEGGGLYIDAGNVIILNCTFEENKAYSGGGIYSKQSILDVSNTTFTLNEAFFNGGAALLINTSLSMDGAVFYRNSAPVGAAMRIQSSEQDIHILHTEFVGNSVLNGAAVHLTLRGGLEDSARDGTLVTVFIDGCSFILNDGQASALEATGGLVNVTDSTFKANRGFLGGAIISSSNTLVLTQNSFVSNSGFFGGAVHVDAGKVTSFNNLFANNTAMTSGGAINGVNSTLFSANDQYESNLASDNGGALFLLESGVVILGGLFRNNSAVLGQGAAVFQTDSTIRLYNTTFADNVNREKPGITEAYTVQLINVQGEWDTLMFMNNIGSVYLFFCTINFIGVVSLTNNTGIAGGALSVVQSTVSFGEQAQVNISDNLGAYGGGVFLSQSDLNMYTPNFVMENNKASSLGGAIFSHQSQISIRTNESLGEVVFKNNVALRGGCIHEIAAGFSVFHGRVLLTNNIAMDGGAMFLSQGSNIFLQKTKQELKSNPLEISLTFSNNSANYGGALFIDDESNNGVLCGIALGRGIQGITTNECFLQVNRLYYPREIGGSTTVQDYNYVNIFFNFNSGITSGNDIYGGLLGRCQISTFSEVFNSFRLLSNFGGFNYIKSIARFQIDLDYNQVFDPYDPEHISMVITKEHVKGLISSSPTRLCFCMNGIYNCSIQHPPVLRKKGETFTVTTATVDQVENAVNGTVLATVLTSGTHLRTDQSRQETKGVCTELFYNVFSSQTSATIQLYPDGPCGNIGVSSKELSISFLPCECPNGLQPAPSDTDCTCECEQTLDTVISQCLLDNDNLTVVRRTKDVWIQYVNNDSTTGFVYSECPFDYCLVEPVNLSFSLPSQVDTQCAYNRSGVLCGECEEGLSLVFGSSRCALCNDNYLALLIAFAVAGIALVAFILILNLTVAVGTIHGLILYANIVSANSPIFLPSETALRLFISWVNLDLGIETCFYHDMDSYAKVLLQIVFPSYVFVLSILIIHVSKYWGRFARLIGRKNPVATLCTLFLLSYSKLLQTIIASLEFVRLTFPSGVTEILWMYNPNIPYFTPARIPMFIIAGVILVLGIIYTTLLLFAQWLRKVKYFQSNKLTPFLDAYHAPFSFKHRYWIGVLLLTRIIHHLLTAVLSESTHLLMVSCLVCTLLILKQLINRVYKNWILDFLETSFLINLLLFAVTTFYISMTNGDQLAAANTSIAIALISFCAIVLFHFHTFFLKSFNSYQKLIVKIQNCFQATRLKVEHNAEFKVDNHIATDSDLHGSLRMNLLREPALDIIAPVSPKDYEQKYFPPKTTPPKQATSAVVDINEEDEKQLL